MTSTIIAPGVIKTLGQLQLFQNVQDPFTQLRFLSGTSLNRSFGAICIVFDREMDAVLLVPYFLKKSHEQIEKIEVPENPESLALRLIAKEAVMQSKTVRILGSPLMVRDKQNYGQRFPKYVVLITDFQLEDRIRIENNSSKNGPPIWVNREILSDIFKKQVLVNDTWRSHPQVEVYKRFSEYFPLWNDLEKW